MAALTRSGARKAEMKCSGGEHYGRIKVAGCNFEITSIPAP
jgi:hypothetical protein